MPRRGWSGIALGDARVPPAADLPRFGRVAHIDGAERLVVEQIARREIRRSAGEIHGLAVDKPQLVHTARTRAGAVEEADGARRLRVGDVEQLDPGGLQSVRAGLVRHRHHIAADLQRVGAHVAVRQLGLADHLRLRRIGDIDAGEILRRRFMREPQNAPAGAGELHAHPLADVAETRQLVVRYQPHIMGFRCHDRLSSRLPLLPQYCEGFCGRCEVTGSIRCR